MIDYPSYQFILFTALYYTRKKTEILYLQAKENESNKIFLTLKLVG